MNKRLYVAYGSNLNFQQMRQRCPTAKLYGTGVIEDYELQFKGHPHYAFATIAPKKNASVPAAVWEIQAKDELSLDRYEGYPSHYFKRDVSVQLSTGEEVSAMVYIMNPRMDFGLPSESYYGTVYEGYIDCELDTRCLEEAIKNSAEEFYSSAVRHTLLQSLTGEGPDDDVAEDDLDEDEDDAFYFSDGMHLGRP